MGLYTKLPSSFLAGVLALLAVQNVQAMPHASVIGGRFTNSSTTASVRPGGMTVSISPATTAAPPRQSSTGSHRIGIMDIDPNMPHDPNPECRYWWDNDGSIACDKMPRSFKITMEQWLEWNPSITKNCGNYITGRSYCVDGPVEAPPTTTTSPPTTTGPPAIETPTPTQPGMVENCNKFYKVQKGELCDVIAPKVGVSEDDIKKWNPGVGADCTDIWANVWICVGLVGGTPPTVTKPTNTYTTPVPTQSGMVDNCSHFYKVKKDDTCKWISEYHAIPLTDILKWNPGVGPDCTGIQAGTWLCWQTIGYTRPTPTSPGTGVATPTAIQPGMVADCDKFYMVKSGDKCDVIAKDNGITLQDFVKWNPGVGATCNTMQSNVHVCVHVKGYTPTPTDPGTGIATPTAIQPGMVADCNKFHFVVSNELCEPIAKKYGISLQDFHKWNPQVGADCGNLWAKVNVCVGVKGYTPTPTDPGNGIQTPSPTQGGMIKNCEKFHEVKEGDNCATIGAKYGIAPIRLEEWHTSITSGCQGLWAKAHVCVRTQGYKPPTKLECNKNGWDYGGNLPAARDSVAQWCDGKDISDGSYGYQPGQTKNGCFNTPYGLHSIRWVGRNDFGSGASMAPSTCEGMLYHLLDNCPKGGKSWFEGWYIEGYVSDSGIRC